MRPSDVTNLIEFNTRMGMFICPCNRGNVVAFLHGYEYGAAGECRFTQTLADSLAEEHGVELDSLGWPHQIQRIAERLSLEWMDVYLLVSSELLLTHVRPRTKNIGRTGGRKKRTGRPFRARGD
ncbi:MAG: hypothetical protein KY475_20145 [Planctomycetes bacterium]|nr:hypothetical protein [Planctomycetota bacterium]